MIGLYIGLIVGLIAGWVLHRAYIRGIYKTIRRLKRQVRGGLGR